ncbi:translation initiation factor eIF-1A [Candidatus Woesearchaeota archaeon]|nr:MAG: translation initiation factor eIF-1A [Candidatus Woesearchaeota archaeon]
MGKKKQRQARIEAVEEQIARIKLPKGNECFGIVEQRLGGARMRVRCLDGKTRICRIPGGKRRYLWVREGDVVVVKPWEFGGEEKGDIILKYTKAQIAWLKEKGYLEKIKEFDEF